MNKEINYLIDDFLLEKYEIDYNNIIDKYNFKELKKFDMNIIGEIHNNESIDYFEKLLKYKKPEYFICEFADTDRCLDKKTLKDRLDNATSGSNIINTADYQYNYDYYLLAYKYNCKLIGCNLEVPNEPKYKNINEEFKFRESYMLKVIKEFKNKNAVVQLGDVHLRSIPYTKEFLNFAKIYKDDRNKSNNLIINNSSPIFDFIKTNKNISISRVQKNYNKEIEFKNYE